MENAKMAEEFYNRIFKEHHKEFNYRRIAYSDWLRATASRLERGDKVLDLGCGNGRALKYFIDMGFQGTGVDISDKMLELARKHVPEGKYCRKDITKVRFRPGSFDAVISFFALNHLSKRQFRGVLASCKRFLKRDGLLMLGMVRGKDEGIFHRFYGENLALYGAGYSRKELADILKSSGYRILKTGERHFKGKHFEEDDIYILAQAMK